MRHRGALIGVALVIGFGTILYATTMRGQRATCDVCIRFNGGRQCATATGQTAEEAAYNAAQTACGTLAGSMEDRINCPRTPPQSRSCRGR